MYLLKAKSKPVQSGRKRKKIPVLGSFEQYKDSKKKPSLAKPIEPASALAPPQSSQAPRVDPKNLASYFGSGGGNQKKDSNMSQK